MDATPQDALAPEGPDAPAPDALAPDALASDAPAPDALAPDASAADAVPDAFHDAPPDEGARWTFDEGTGQFAADRSGHGNDLVLGATAAVEAGDPAWTSATTVCRGSGLDFDGTDDFAATAGVLASGRARFSMSFCITPRSGGAGTYGRVLSRESSVGLDDTYVCVQGDAISVVLWDGPTAYVTLGAAGTMPSGVRTCWAMVYDDLGDRAVHAYRDGAEIAYERQDVVPVEAAIVASGGPWTVGNRPASDRPFDGVIDELQIDDHILTPDEIAARATCP